MKDIPQLKVDLCGAESDPTYAAQVHQRIAALKLQDNVTMHGIVPQSTVKQKLKQATMLVLPSLQENAPMVVAEAMAGGVPVVASNLCGVPDMVVNGKSGLLIDDPHDAAALALAIKQLLTDAELRVKMITSAKADAVRKFHPTEVAKATVAVYKEVLGARG